MSIKLSSSSVETFVLVPRKNTLIYDFGIMYSIIQHIFLHLSELHVYIQLPG